MRDRVKAKLCISSIIGACLPTVKSHRLYHPGSESCRQRMSLYWCIYNLNSRSNLSGMIDRLRTRLPVV